MIRPDTLLLAFAINPTVMMGLFSNIVGLFFLLMLFLFFIGSVTLWLEFPASTATYLLLSSSVYAILKALIATRARKISDSGEELKLGFSEIVLSIPMGIALAIALYLWCVGFISLIYSNFYILIFIGIIIAAVYFLWDFIQPWIPKSKQRKPNSDNL